MKPLQGFFYNHLKKLMTFYHLQTQIFMKPSSIFLDKGGKSIGRKLSKAHLTAYLYQI